MIFSKLMNHKIFIIIALSFVTSVVYGFWYQIPPVVDAQAYDRIALNLLSGNGFREDLTQSFDYDSAMLRAGPGYEFFLAGIYFLFGHHYEAVWIIQALLHALTAWFLYKSAIVLWPDKKNIGLIATGVIGFHPDLIEISAMLMTETAYLFFVAVILYLFIVLMRQRSFFIASLLGLSLGMGIVLRPPLVLFIPIILLYCFTKKYWSELLIVVGCIFVLLAPWTIRNYILYERFIPTTLIGDYNIWIGNRANANGGQIASGFNPVTTYVTEHGVRDLSSASRSAFLSFVLQTPGEFAKLTMLRVVRYGSLIRPMGFWFYQTGIPQLIFVVLSGFSIAFLFLFGVAGLFLNIKNNNATLWYIAALALSAPLPLLITVVESRYRFQIYPFFALFGAYAFVLMKERVSEVRRALLASVLMLGGLSLIDILFFWNTVFEHVQRFL